MTVRHTVLFGITDSQSLILVSALIREFSIRNWSASVVTGGSRQPSLPESHQVKVHWLRHLRRKPSPFRDGLAIVQIYKRIVDEKPSMVVFGTPKVSLLGMVAARIAGVEQRAFIIRGSLVSSSHWLFKPWLWAAEALTCSLATIVIAVSDSLRQEVVRMRIVAPERCQLVGGGSSHGVDLERFSSIRIHTASPCNIGFVGRLSKGKGLEILIKAFQLIQTEFPEVKLYLVGPDDGFLPETMRLVGGNNGVVFRHGGDHGQGLFEGFDILCLPSQREGFPTVVLEAGALGIPVVASDVTGSRDAVLDGKTGMLVQHGNYEELARQVRRLMVSPSLRQKFGENARYRVESVFNEQLVTSSYYAELTNRFEA